MKSTIFALLLGLLAIHAQAAEAVPAESGHLVFGLAVLVSPVLLGCLFFYGLFRKRVCSATPQRRRLTWAAIWTVAPFLYLLPFGGTSLYLPAGWPLYPALIPLSLLLGSSQVMEDCCGWGLAVAGWALLGLLYAAVRTRILNRRAKRAAAALSPEPQPAPER